MIDDPDDLYEPSADPSEGLQAPAQPPQMDTEDNSPIRDLVLNSPAWDSAYGFELAHILRRSQAIRSALMLALNIAGMAEVGFRGAQTMEDVRTIQGKIAGLSQFFDTLMTDAEGSELPEDEEDEVPN